VSRSLPTGRVLVGLIATILLAGCASSATPPPSPTPATQSPPATPSAALTTPTLTPAPTPIPTPAITPMPSAVALGETTLTASNYACEIGSSDTPVQCTVVSNDPRVTGAYKATFHSNRWGSDPAHGAMVQWGTARLVNAGGVWAGPYSGIFAAGRGDIITTWYTGSGGYAGLSYYETITVAPTGGGWEAVGLIFPGLPPAR
jgi:hypothetical protein